MSFMLSNDEIMNKMVTVLEFTENNYCCCGEGRRPNDGLRYQNMSFIPQLNVQLKISFVACKINQRLSLEVVTSFYSKNDTKTIKSSI